uniref:Protein FAM50A n=1 Tax=Pygocentrus nattereri TaxID=42514 RepID=A0AAR2JPB9_PYGNA
MAQYKGAASEAGRAMQLMKKREREREQLEQLKQKIAEDNMVKSNIDKKFSAHYDAVEQELKSSTVGLVTLNDMKAKQEALVKEREKQLAKKEQSKELQLKLEKQKEKKRKEEQKRKIASLSFNPDEGEDEEEEENDEEEEDDTPIKKKKLGKNPDVDTSFLPDREREEEENRLREELRQEWERKQEKIKGEEIEITFSYWDGSGHRKTVKLLPLGVATADHLPPSCPIHCLLYFQTNHLHVHLHYIHKPSLRSTSSPSTRQLHLQHSLIYIIDDISIYPLFLLNTCPNHLNLASLALSPNCSTFTVPLICSFLILSILVTPNENLSIFISATSSLASCLLDRATVSKPYKWLL